MKPQPCTRRRFLDATGQTCGVKAARGRAGLARRGLGELQRFPAPILTARQRTSAAVIQWSLKDSVRSASFAKYNFVFEQILDRNSLFTLRD